MDNIYITERKVVSGIAAVVITACSRAAAVHARPRAGMD